MKKTFVAVCLAAVAFGAEGYHVLNKIKIGGPGGWDYLTLDPDSRRLYVSHQTSVAVVDADSGKLLGSIGDLQRVHGIAIVAEFNKGFITANSVVIFDPKTLAKTGEAKAGNNPDAICYEPKTKHVFAINHSSNDATAIDARTGNPLATFAVGPAPEFCVVDGSGKLYVNIEDSHEIVEIDAAKNEVARRASLAPCERPTGLAIDVKNKKAFAACSNKVMAVVDLATMKVIASPPIGGGADGAGFDPGPGLAFSSNGGDGTMTIVKLVNGKYEAVDTVPTGRGARTMTVDEKLHRVYLSAAEYGPPPAPPKEGEKKAGGRGAPLPDSFHVLVVGK